MAVTDSFMLWSLSLFLIWFFLCKAKDKGRDKSDGWRNLGWFLWIMTGLVGFGLFIKNGDIDPTGFIASGIVFIIGILRLTRGLTDDYEEGV